MKQIDDFFLQKEEPIKSCLLALRDIILNYDEQITETVKYGMPCYCFKGKMFCYFWTDKKTGEPYILMVDGRLIDHPKLTQGKRSRMKILPIDPNKDVPIEIIDEIFRLSLKYRV